MQEIRLQQKLNQIKTGANTKKAPLSYMPFRGENSPKLKDSPAHDTYQNSSKEEKINILPYILIVLGAFITAGAATYGITKLVDKIKNRIIDPKNFELVHIEAPWPKDWAATINESYKIAFKRKFPDPILKGDNTDTMRNGYIVLGPKSKSRDDFMSWTLKEMKKAGVKIFDATDPKTGTVTLESMMGTLDDAGFNTEHRLAEFQRTGRYHLYYVDDILAPGYNVNNKPYAECFLRGATAKSRTREGLILAYGAKNTEGFYAALRSERIDAHYSPVPYKDEPIETWLEYLESMRTMAGYEVRLKLIEEVKEIFSKRSIEDQKAIEPYMHITLPYKMPLNSENGITERLNNLEKYLAASEEHLEDWQAYIEFEEVVQKIYNSYGFSKTLTIEKVNQMTDMVEQHTPEKYRPMIRAKIKEIKRNIEKERLEKKCDYQHLDKYTLSRQHPRKSAIPTSEKPKIPTESKQ